MIPVAFVIVLGLHALGNSALVDPKTIFVTFASKVFGTGEGVDRARWLIAIMLILALILSALNAITGTARSLHQMSTDGHFPRVLPAASTTTASRTARWRSTSSARSLVVFMGGAVQIYTFSNVGYLASFLPVLVGYYLLRKYRPNVRRPFRLPEWMKYVALAIAGFYAIIYFYGGPVYAILHVLTRPDQDAAVLLHRHGHAAALPAAVLVPQAGRGQARRHRDGGAARRPAASAGGSP